MRPRLAQAVPQAVSRLLSVWGLVMTPLVAVLITAAATVLEPAQSSWVYPTAWAAAGAVVLWVIAYVWSLVRFRKVWLQTIWEQGDHSYAQMEVRPTESQKLGDHQIRVITPSGIDTGWLYRGNAGPPRPRGPFKGVSCRFPLAGQPLEVGRYKVMWRGRVRVDGPRRLLSVEKWNRDRNGEWHRA